MKKQPKLSLKERNRLIYKQRNGQDRKKIKIKGTKNKNKIKRNPNHPKNTRLVNNIDLPEKFDLHQDPDKVLNPMNQFRAIVDKDQPKLKHLNFNAIKDINPSSALMLAAEIDVWNQKTKTKLRSRHTKWDNKIKFLLCEMGFFELLRLPPLEKSQKIDQNITFLRFISGHKSEGEKAQELRKNIEQVIGKELENKLHLYDGLTEAFTNTTQHAYDNENIQEFDKWWIVAAYDKESNKLTVSMYDRGKSIPATMRTGKKWLFLDERKTTSDNKLITIAMEKSFEQKNTRSKTKKLNRGKGLKQLLDFTKNTGEITIISHKGYCVFKVVNDKLSIIKTKELKHSLQGTLIEWVISLP